MRRIMRNIRRLLRPGTYRNEAFMDHAQNLGFSDDDLFMMKASYMWDNVLNYNAFMLDIVDVGGANSFHAYGTSFPHESSYAKSISDAAYQQILQLARDTYDTVVRERVPGALIEFGVAEGYWLKMILDHMDAVGEPRPTWGFDSFEGLPQPDPAVDGEFWQKGQYAAKEDAVRDFVGAKHRPHLTLVKGWFSDTLQQPEAQSIESVAYAKIDCDLYNPAVECLDYLRGRLANGAILMFDDWTHVSDMGETKAFMEWVPTVPQYRFELVGFINYRIFFRVWHR